MKILPDIHIGQLVCILRQERILKVPVVPGFSFPFFFPPQFQNFSLLAGPLSVQIVGKQPSVTRAKNILVSSKKFSYSLSLTLLSLFAAACCNLMCTTVTLRPFQSRCLSSARRQFSCSLSSSHSQPLTGYLLLAFHAGLLVYLDLHLVV